MTTPTVPSLSRDPALGSRTPSSQQNSDPAFRSYALSYINPRPCCRLLLLLGTFLAFISRVHSQSSTTIQTPTILTIELPTATAQYFHLPKPSNSSPTTTYVTLNLCTSPVDNPAYSYPQILIVSNSSNLQFPSSSNLPIRSRGLVAIDSRRITGDYSSSNGGFANVTIVNSAGLWIAVQAPQIANQDQSQSQTQRWSIQLAVSTEEPIHSVNSLPAFKLDDTDQNAALLTAADSSLFLSAATTQPLSLSQFYPYIIPTPSKLSMGLSSSLCALQNFNSTSRSQPLATMSTSLTRRGTGLGMFSSQPSLNASDNDFRISTEQAGLRTQYMINNLTSNTNYTAWFFQPGPIINNLQTGRLWPYVNFRTKSTNKCKLVQDVPFCPAVAYAIPSTSNQTTSALLSSYEAVIRPHLSNFTRVISTYPCDDDDSGRYSFVSGCGDCIRAYTDWICAIKMPRCTDAPNVNLDADADSTVTDLGLLNSNPDQLVFPRTRADQSRTPQFGGTDTFPYGEILPCHSTCTLVAATCPPLIGWNCPLVDGINRLVTQTVYGQPRELQANEVMGGESTGAGGGGVRSSDRFGNVYCNSLGSDLAYSRQGSGVSYSIDRVSLISSIALCLIVFAIF